MTDRPRNINRAAWGGRPRPQLDRLDPLRVEGVALHWPGTTTRYQTVAGVSAALRAWQKNHQDIRGWADIAYQVAIDQQGNTYSLRGLRYRSAANGDADVNERFGALLLVLAIGEQPTGAMIRAVSRRVERHRDLFPRSHKIVPHSAIRPEPTDCPGDRVRALIADGTFGDPNHRK